MNSDVKNQIKEVSDMWDYKILVENQ